MKWWERSVRCEETTSLRDIGSCRQSKVIYFEAILLTIVSYKCSDFTPVRTLDRLPRRSCRTPRKDVEVVNSPVTSHTSQLAADYSPPSSFFSGALTSTPMLLSCAAAFGASAVSEKFSKIV